MRDWAHAVTEIQAPSSVKECSRLRRLVSRLASASLHSGDAADLELAIGEALSNAVKYGASGSKLVVLVDPSVRELAVVLSYPGSRFDTHVKRPKDPSKAEGGFGRFIIRQIMDDMEYRFPEGRTILRLTKRKTPDHRHTRSSRLG